jgi:methyl-accepting chemotaxis protein
MSGERATGQVDDLDEWLDARARELAVDRETLLARIVAAHRLALGADPGGPDDPLVTLTERVTALEADLDDHVEDLRSRIVQLKRELDDATGGAVAGGDDAGGRDHGDLRAEIDALAADLEELRRTVATVDRSADHYETVAAELDAETATLRERTDRLAGAALDLRDRVADLEATADARDDLTELRREAAEKGVPAGDCGGCGRRVHLGLLADPVCPHCDARLAGVRPARGFFGDPTLTTASPPALDGPREASDGE